MKIVHLLLFLLLVFQLRAQERVIVDCDYSRVNAAGQPLGGGEAASENEFPLRVPTSPQETVFATPPSSVLLSNENQGGMKAPFVRISLKPKLPENFKAGEYPYAEAGPYWKFSRTPLGGGKFEAEWTLMPLSSLRNLKMAFTLMGEKADGSLVRIEPTVAAQEIPLLVVASGDKLSAGEESVPLKANKANEIRISFDLQKNTWSAELNGKKVIRNREFPQGYLSQFKTFKLVGFGFQGGGNDEVQGAEYAVGPFRLLQNFSGK